MDWTFELLMKPCGIPLTEGPVWDGEQLLFTHIHASSILRLDVASGAISPWRTGTNRTNGLAFDSQGRLFGCCSGGRSVLRFDPDGTDTVVTDRIDGKRLNTPNDLAIDRKGRIWFSNPINSGNWDRTEQTELPDQSVLRCDPQPDGSYTTTRVTFDTTMPNGVLLSQDQRTLYVAESGYAKGVPRELRAYPIRDDGSLGTFATLFTWGEDARGAHRGIDGMCLDRDGNILATAGWEVAGPGPMIYVFSPTGRVLETHPVPAIRPTNCAFGGADMSTLFVTTTEGHLFRARTGRVGWSMYP
ncbi:MAG: SMP-30/gluconolactonase/LRE family protein [bacterium]|jgi:gluconolactonase|nr:SMP-30/gluconolactonase/LRE family protein [Betaproteobacteria bacterium]